MVVVQACRAFENEGRCVPLCPPQGMYTYLSHTYIPNPDAKFSYGTKCVDQCPREYVLGEYVTLCLICLGFWATVWATVCKTVRPMLSDRCLSCPVCLSVTLVYSGQTVRLIKMPLSMEVSLCPGHTTLDGDPAHPPPRPKRSTAPTFRPISIVANRSPISGTA